MITITNRKVAGFEPRWASFSGFSLLFDNPGDSLTPMGNMHKINCSIDHPALEFYRAFTEALDEIGRDLLINTYLFCPLPPSSYHVTAWDGINDGNIERIKATEQPDLAGFLDALPDAILNDTKFIRIVNESPLVTKIDRPITFRFGKQVRSGNLIPADRESEISLEQIKAERKELNEKFEELFGIKTAREPFSPHVSIGYFANKECAELARPRRDDLAEIVKRKAEGLTITFNSISLYGFTDMITFFKADQSRGKENV